MRGWSYMNLSKLIDILFWIGILSSFIGGIMIVASFTVFKRKVMKTPIYKEVEPENKKDFPWGFILFISGIAVFFLSYYLSVRYNM